MKPGTNYSDLTKGQFKISGLRNLTTNSLKTIKGQSTRNVLTGILYLAPYTRAGIQASKVDASAQGLPESTGKTLTVCPKSTAGCRAGCLFMSGSRIIFKSNVTAAINKTRRFFSDRDTFMIDLAWDIAKITRAANKRGYQPAIRLNGTSDIAWERIAVTWNGTRYGNLMEAFPDVQFYDYTKRTDRKDLPPNYSILFSRSEENEKGATRMLARGINVAVVFFASNPEVELPSTWKGHRVIDGDQDDTRFMDQRGVVIGLRSKAYARKDTSGFIVRIEA